MKAFVCLDRSKLRSDVKHPFQAGRYCGAFSSLDAAKEAWRITYAGVEEPSFNDHTQHTDVFVTTGLTGSKLVGRIVIEDLKDKGDHL